MNWYHREEERYVEYGSSFRAAQRFGITRQLTDTVYNMNRAHLSARDADRLRVARRRRGPHGRNDVPDVPRPPPPRAGPRQRPLARRRGADAASGDGSARAVLRRHLRLAAHALPLGAGHARDTRPPFRLRLGVHGRARPVRLPAALAARQRLAFPQARPRGPAPIARAGRPAACPRRERGRRPRRLPRRARADRHGRPLPGSRRATSSGCRTSSPSWACSARRGRLAGTGRRRGPRPWNRGSPCAPRSARRWSTRCTRPSATRCGRRSPRSRWRSTASIS